MTGTQRTGTRDRAARAMFAAFLLIEGLAAVQAIRFYHRNPRG